MGCRMAVSKHQFVVDDSGERKAIILDIAEYQRLVEAAEELEALQAYDAAKVAGDETTPFDQAVDEIERNRE